MVRELLLQSTFDLPPGEMGRGVTARALLPLLKHCQCQGVERPFGPQPLSGNGKLAMPYDTLHGRARQGAVVDGIILYPKGYHIVFSLLGIYEVQKTELFYYTGLVQVRVAGSHVYHMIRLPSIHLLSSRTTFSRKHTIRIFGITVN